MTSRLLEAISATSNTKIEYLQIGKRQLTLMHFIDIPLTGIDIPHERDPSPMPNCQIQFHIFELVIHLREALAENRNQRC